MDLLAILATAEEAMGSLVAIRAAQERLTCFEKAVERYREEARWDKQQQATNALHAQIAELSAARHTVRHDGIPNQERVPSPSPSLKLSPSQIQDDQEPRETTQERFDEHHHLANQPSGQQPPTDVNESSAAGDGRENQPEDDACDRSQPNDDPALVNYREGQPQRHSGDQTPLPCESDKTAPLGERDDQPESTAHSQAPPTGQNENPAPVDDREAPEEPQVGLQHENRPIERHNAEELFPQADKDRGGSQRQPQKKSGPQLRREKLKALRSARGSRLVKKRGRAKSKLRQRVSKRKGDSGPRPEEPTPSLTDDRGAVTEEKEISEKDGSERTETLSPRRQIPAPAVEVNKMTRKRLRSTKPTNYDLMDAEAQQGTTTAHDVHGIVDAMDGRRSPIDASNDSEESVMKTAGPVATVLKSEGTRDAKVIKPNASASPQTSAAPPSTRQVKRLSTRSARTIGVEPSPAKDGSEPIVESEKSSVSGEVEDHLAVLSAGERLRVR